MGEQPSRTFPQGRLILTPKEMGAEAVKAQAPGKSIYNGIYAPSGFALQRL
jgi:hypothetical protein